LEFRRITSRAEFEQMIELGKTSESKHLEFKSGYGWRAANKDDQAVELCRDVAQFANTDGGVLLIGLTEVAGPGGRKVAGPVRPVDDVDGLRNWLEQAIRNYLTPSTFTRDVIAVETAAGLILAVNTSPSLHLVALWHKQLKVGIEYLYRTDHGKQWMNPDEVERHLMNASRATRLAVQQVKATASSQGPVELVPAINALAYDGDGALLVIAQGVRPVLGNCSERSVGLTVFADQTNRCIEIPYGVIRDAWVTTDGRPGLYLSVRLLKRDDGDITIEPLDQGFPASD
jgi:Putative DNA-binding domain